MKKQKHVKKKNLNMTQKKKNLNMTQKKKNLSQKKKEYGKNFQPQMTENQSINKEKMNLNKKLMLGKTTW